MVECMVYAIVKGHLMRLPPPEKPARSKLPGALISVALLMAAATSGTPFAEEPASDSPQGTVTEVKGTYAKVASSASMPFQKGDEVDLVRERTTTIRIPATVTAVETSYIVVKVSSGVPRLGDVCVARGAKPTASTSKTTDSGSNTSASTATKRPIRKTRQQILAEKMAEQQAEAKKQWEALLERTGVSPWPVATEEEHNAMIDKHKAMIEKVAKTYPNMRLYETENFLFQSNIPPAQVTPYVTQLDKMHQMLMSMYRIPADTRVWLGKAYVIAFISQQQFVHFEQTFFQNVPGSSTYGLCHQNSRGEVVVSCYRGNNPNDFGQMLVHETSHGFLHRYKTPSRLPSWVNEGLAEYVGAMVVPASNQVRLKQKLEMKMVAQTGSLGGVLMPNQAGQAFSGYGIASLAVTFMIKMDERKFVQFIDYLKGGLSYEEALAQSYGATPEQFVAVFGASLGMPQVRP